MTEAAETTDATSDDRADARRIIRTYTGRFERKWLPRMAAVMPAWVTPDKLTTLGILSSALIGILYYVSAISVHWLWVVSALYVVHWFADSLDGTLARVRKTERPRYGFFLDHSADAIAALFILLGLGLSPHMDLRIAFGLLLCYYLMMIYVLLRACTLREFKISYGRLGPTEMRIGLILVNTALWVQNTWFSSDRLATLLGVPIRLMDLIGIGAGIVMASIFIGTMFGSLRQLAKLEPPGVVRD